MKTTAGKELELRARAARGKSMLSRWPRPVRDSHPGERRVAGSFLARVLWLLATHRFLHEGGHDMRLNGCPLRFDGHCAWPDHKQRYRGAAQC